MHRVVGNDTTSTSYVKESILAHSSSSFKYSKGQSKDEITLSTTSDTPVSTASLSKPILHLKSDISSNTPSAIVSNSISLSQSNPTQESTGKQVWSSDDTVRSTPTTIKVPATDSITTSTNEGQKSHSVSPPVSTLETSPSRGSIGKITTLDAQSDTRNLVSSSSVSSIEGLSEKIITSTRANNEGTVTITKWMDATGRLYPTPPYYQTGVTSLKPDHTKLAVGLAIPLGIVALVAVLALLCVLRRRKQRASIEHEFSPDKEADMYHKRQSTALSFVPRVSLESDPRFDDLYIHERKQQEDTDSIVDFTYPVVDPVRAHNSVFFVI